MKYYIKQKVFSWGDKFHIYDASGQERFLAQGEVFSFGKKLHLYSMSGEEVAYIHQKVWSFLPKYYISKNGCDIAEVVKEFTLFRSKYSVDGLGWSVSGDFWSHEFGIYRGSSLVAAINKRWFSWGDTYEIDIADGVDDISALCVVLIIDAVIAAADTAAASGGAS